MRLAPFARYTLALAFTIGIFFILYVSMTLPGGSLQSIKYGSNWLPVNFHSHHPQPNIRILCAIMTMPANHGTKAKAVRDTWAKRCDLTIFFTTKADDNVFSNWTNIILNVSEGRWFLWEKTRAAFLHIHKYYSHQFDWFLKADDDTYFIMENLRLLLFDHDPNDRTFIGCELVIPGTKQHFPSGGAGYILSRGALDAFATTVHEEEIEWMKIANTTTIKPLKSTVPPTKPPLGCDSRDSSIGEDVRFTICLEKAGAKLIDTQDKNGSFRFLPTMLEHFVWPERNGGNGWVWGYGHPKQGINECCHKNLISIHYTPPKMMYTFEFLIYHLKVGNVSL